MVQVRMANDETTTGERGAKEKSLSSWPSVVAQGKRASLHSLNERIDLVCGHFVEESGIIVEQLLQSSHPRAWQRKTRREKTHQDSARCHGVMRVMHAKVAPHLPREQ